MTVPLVAMAAVALGLRLGAPEEVRAAVVYGAPPAAAGTGLAWQITLFRQDHGVREPTGGVSLDVLARSGKETVRWHGTTNADGVAEMLLPLTRGTAVWLSARAGAAVVARGWADAPPPVAPRSEARTRLPFARRDGPIALVVAILGSAAAPGFPADLWARATNRTTAAPIAGASVGIESDSVGASAATDARTDSRGWANVSATAVGLAVTMTLRAKSADGASGQWIGGLPTSPGATNVETRLRWTPQQEPEIDLSAPTVRTTTYLEIDDSHGRAWAATPSLARRPDGTSQAAVLAPRLAPGLYWAVASSAPSGATGFGSGSIARPFFVASSDGEALAMGEGGEPCAPPRDVREGPRALATCLAFAGETPVPRWVALDGFMMQIERDRVLRARGLRVAVGALLAAVLLEAVLLVRAAMRPGVRGIFEVPDDASDRPDAGSVAAVIARRWGSVALALLIALLGFALLAAFLIRLA